ncbi:unnamed protein product [Rodentolepis nana]|uniref:DHC_N1 domain-containing protein n=1 Tax=Rodentolepis nana TaxID=102285 RepID=A0A0R3TTY0_RODNA|nr:unnamed protein product [Rodentolepis nana]
MPLEEIEDSRLRFVFDYLQVVTDRKVDKLLKLKDDADIIEKILKYFENQEELIMIIIIPPSGIMEVYNHFPAEMKGKGYYFIKNHPAVFEKHADLAQLKSGITYGDLHKSPIHHFTAFVNSVLAPIILNEKNREDWPESLNQNIKRDLYNLQKKSEFVLEIMEGRTHLTLPKNLDKLISGQDPVTANGEDGIGSMLSSIEMTVVDWNKKINECLEQTSSASVPVGEFALPSHEFDFWNQRMKSLQDIYEQLLNPEVMRMASILEENGSAYTSMFKKLFKKVVRGTVEAEDIVIYLSPLLKYLNEVEAAGFEECKPKIQPIVHLLALIWINCNYYRDSKRMAQLISEIGNFIIQMCRSFLDPSEIVKEEPDEGLKKIIDSLDILNHFRLTVDEYRGKVRASCNQRDIKPSEWKFHNSWIFSRLDVFISRLELIKASLLASISLHLYWLILKYFLFNMDYNRLEKVEALGVEGSKLSTRLLEIYEDYQNAYKGFTDLSMDCLSTEDKIFENEIEKYFKFIEAYDRRMCSIILQSFNTCPDVTAMFKTIYMFGSLMERPLIKSHVDHCFQKLLEMINKDLDVCKRILDQHVGNSELLEQAVFKNFPPVSGAIAWSMQIQRRADALMKPLSDIINQYVNAFRITKDVS